MDNPASSLYNEDMGYHEYFQRAGRIQMNADRARCAVVGAANIDIGGFPAGLVAMGDSNPGRVRVSAGGVGRNIACNLARLGVETHLLTALGGDAFAGIIREDCAAAGVDLSHALECPEAGSSIYLFIADADGDMRLAVNDMAICARLTPEALSSRLDWLNAMDAVILDANLPSGTLAFLAQNLRAPLFADAVSAAKARKLLPILPRLRALKPNALEAAVLTGMPVNDAPAVEAAARRLVSLGVERACVTLGERGVCIAGDGRARIIPGPPVRMVNATGAGDAFIAALAWADLRGMDLADSARAGLAAASIAVESPETVSPALSAEALLSRMSDISE